EARTTRERRRREHDRGQGGGPGGLLDRRGRHAGTVAEASGTRKRAPRGRVGCYVARDDRPATAHLRARPRTGTGGAPRAGIPGAFRRPWPPARLLLARAR